MKMFMVFSLGPAEYSKEEEEDDDEGGREVDGITGCDCEGRSSSKVWDTDCGE